MISIKSFLALVLVIGTLPTGLFAQEQDCLANTNINLDSIDSTESISNGPSETMLCNSHIDNIPHVGVSLNAQSTAIPPITSTTYHENPSAPTTTGMQARQYLTPEQFDSRFSSGSDFDSNSGGGGSGKPPTAVIVLLPLLVGVGCIGGIWIFAVMKSRRIVREQEAELRFYADARQMEDGGGRLNHLNSNGNGDGGRVGGLSRQHGQGQDRGVSGPGDLDTGLLPPPPAYSREPPR
ncbi:hypothetical protein BJX70DRAFT_72481 [Aspergillus crustosus]